MRAWVVFAAVTLVTANARAQDEVGVVVVGESTLQPTVTAAISGWLQQQGHQVAAAPLPSETVSMVADCFVIEDPGCARALVDQRATTRSLLYVNLEAQDGNVTIVAHWFERGQAPVERRAMCSACTDAKLGELAQATAGALVPARPRPEATSTSQSGASLAKTSDTSEPERARAGLAVGVELGEPTSAVAGWFFDRFAVIGAVGTGTRAGLGVSLHVDGHVTIMRLTPRMPLYGGLGVRYYHHGYGAMSVDEIPDSHYGIRALVGLALDRRSLQIYSELAPGIDIRRTRSCTLLSGPNSICPHAQDGPVFVQFVVGVRWFLSHR